MRIRLKSKLSNKLLLLTVAAVALTIFTISLYSWPDDNTPAIEANIITYSTDTPDENKPDDKYNWMGGPDDPKYIKLPTIDTEGYIQNVGVDQNGEIAVPTNIHIAGWFASSVRPGQVGLSIIDGHVDGREEPGIFRELANLKESDEYTVEMGDGSLEHYRVKKVVTVATKDAINVLFSQEPSIKKQLNLITCGGSFDTTTQQYNKRVIVISEFTD